MHLLKIRVDQGTDCRHCLKDFIVFVVIQKEIPQETSLSASLSHFTVLSKLFLIMNVFYDSQKLTNTTNLQEEMTSHRLFFILFYSKPPSQKTIKIIFCYSDGIS